MKDDTISRQAAIDAMGIEPLAFSEYENGLHDKWEDDVEALMKLPPAQPEVRTQMFSADCISRQDAIDALDCINGAEEVLRSLPSAQPEIIRCKNCKYQDENWRRVSVRWLPCMDVRTGSNWYCGSAERGDRSEQ